MYILLSTIIIWNVERKVCVKGKIQFVTLVNNTHVLLCMMLS